LHRSTPPHSNNGFSLVELAIVLVIVALLTSGLLLGISAQRNAAENVDAQRQLENIREALLGFAMANGRLPCPADPALTSADVNKVGLEDPPNGPCNRVIGAVPWATLSLPELDPWGNRFTYFASNQFTAVPTGGALASFSLSTGVAPNSTAGLANINDGNGNNIASDLPAVIVSHGSHSAGAWQPSGVQLPGAAGDELENANITPTFISHTPSNSFDDLVTWVVPSILKSKMVAAGRLP
jgi:prepilin-type N-terminal cleavage/methylation domain-containing protein